VNWLQTGLFFVLFAATDRFFFCRRTTALFRKPNYRQFVMHSCNAAAFLFMIEGISIYFKDGFNNFISLLYILIMLSAFIIAVKFEGAEVKALSRLNSEISNSQ
jgi:hypothetical protein